MLRDKSLIPLSHQHQHALALCVRIDRASPIPDTDLPIWLEEVTLQFKSEIEVHFLAEEKVLFPVAKRFSELETIVRELLADHVSLRAAFQAAECGTMSAKNLREFAKQLSLHIRKEEAQLFEGLQKCMTPQELATVGRDLQAALQTASTVCSISASRKTKS